MRVKIPFSSFPTTRKSFLIDVILLNVVGKEKLLLNHHLITRVIKYKVIIKPNFLIIFHTRMCVRTKDKKI